MSAEARVTPDNRALTVTIPLRIKQRGGRKLVVAPDGVNTPPKPQPDNTLIKAFARAHRWHRRLETGEFASIAELARAERITKSYLCRILRLTLLAPDLLEAILDGRQARELQLAKLMGPFPVHWPHQRRLFLSASAP